MRRLLLIALLVVGSAGRSLAQAPPPPRTQLNGASTSVTYLTNYATGMSRSCSGVTCDVSIDLTACPGGQYMTDVTSGAAVCAQVAFSQLSGQLGDGQIANGAVDLDGAEVEGQLPWSKVGVTPTPGPASTPTATTYPTVLPTSACDEAIEVGRYTGDADALDGQVGHSCTDLGATTCVGGTNDGVACSVASQCPSGWCTRYAWRRSSAARVSAGGVPSSGFLAWLIDFAASFSVSSPAGSNGKVTVAPGAAFKMDGEPLASGEVPGNIQPVAINSHPASGHANAKHLGPSNEVSYGYSTQKYCWGGTNANATCSADSACPGGVCQDFEIHDGKPARFDDGVAFGVPVKPADAASELRSGTASWCIGDGTNDQASLGMGRRLSNRSQHRTIDKVCWTTNIIGGAIAIRRSMAFPTAPAATITPGYGATPTYVLPTPTVAATPGAAHPDAGCLTGQSIDWPKDTQLWVQWTQATGVNNLCVDFSWSIKP